LIDVPGPTVIANAGQVKAAGRKLRHPLLCIGRLWDTVIASGRMNLDGIDPTTSTRAFTRMVS